MTVEPIRTGIAGVGKMGVSHLAIASAHPRMQLAAACDSQAFVLAGLRSQIDIETYRSFEKMIDDGGLDAVFVATPTSSHAKLASYALEHGVHVFVEKPLTLTSAESSQLADEATVRNLANQVGYHNRFIGTFRETARLVAAGAIGDVHHIDGRAFGQVVTKAQGGGRTWRSRKSEGGGCLHDYACHVIDLMNFVVGRPRSVMGANLSSIYSSGVEDAVYALFDYDSGAVGTLETNWSDESYRKMTTSITVYGTLGKIYADRQECRLFLKPGHSFEKFDDGWTVRYITELQDPVDYYLRGEEYSSQIDAFANAISLGDSVGACSFAEAADADWVVEQIAAVHDRDTGAVTPAAVGGSTSSAGEVAGAVRELAMTTARQFARSARTSIRNFKERRR